MVQDALSRGQITAHLRLLAAADQPQQTGAELRRLLDRLSNRDVAEALFKLTSREMAALLDQLPDDILSDLFAELEPAEGAHLLLRLPRARAADTLEGMDPDDAADLMAAVGRVDKRAADGLLLQLPPAAVESVRALLTYPKDSAGGVMTPRFVAVRPDMAVEEALIAAHRQAAERATELIYYLYVTDADQRLLGVISLRQLVLAPPGARVTSVMRHDFAAVRPETDQENVARLLNDKNLLALPVVDAGGRLLGIVTADDIADVIEEEATEDIQHLGGSEPLEMPYPRASVWWLTRKRIGWLLLLFAAEAYTGTVMRAFESELQAAVALTFFIPLLIGTGGNIGSQVVTTIIRAEALGQVRLSDMGRVLWKEWRVAIVLAAALCAATFVRAWLLGVDADVRRTVAVAVIPIVLWAATVGAILPLVLRRLRVDPAVVSAPFITTLVDGTGLLIYFEVARLLLDRD